MLKKQLRKKTCVYLNQKNNINNTYIFNKFAVLNLKKKNKVGNIFFKKDF